MNKIVEKLQEFIVFIITLMILVLFSILGLSIITAIVPFSLTILLIFIVIGLIQNFFSKLFKK